MACAFSALHASVEQSDPRRGSMAENAKPASDVASARLRARCPPPWAGRPCPAAGVPHHDEAARGFRPTRASEERWEPRDAGAGRNGFHREEVFRRVVGAGPTDELPQTSAGDARKGRVRRLRRNRAERRPVIGWPGARKHLALAAALLRRDPSSPSRACRSRFDGPRAREPGTSWTAGAESAPALTPQGSASPAKMIHVVDLFAGCLARETSEHALAERFWTSMGRGCRCC